MCVTLDRLLCISRPQFPHLIQWQYWTRNDLWWSFHILWSYNPLRGIGSIYIYSSIFGMFPHLKKRWLNIHFLVESTLYTNTIDSILCKDTFNILCPSSLKAKHFSYMWWTPQLSTPPYKYLIISTLTRVTFSSSFSLPPQYKSFNS